MSVMIKLQAKTHSKMNGSKNITDNTGKSEFIQNPHIEVSPSNINFKGVRSLKNVSKLKKFVSKIFGATSEVANNSGFGRMTKYCGQMVY